MTGVSRSLRRRQTDAERRLWERIRDRQLGGHKFRRQYPIGGYVADFCCFDRKLVVELDGGQHAETVERDTARDVVLRANGYRVIRFGWLDQLPFSDNMWMVIEKPKP